MPSGIIESFYANFFTVGALIPTIFHAFLSFLFLSIKKKSRPTLHLGIAFLYLAVFNFAYFIAAGFYHPLAAYHRWLTVGFILLHQAHMNMFILSFNGDMDRRREIAALAVQYAVSLAVSAFFFACTFSSGKVFLFSAHQWDFDADAISGVIGRIILAYVAVFMALVVWKAAVTKTGGRFVIMSIGAAYVFASMVPSVANILSRAGMIDRGTFQVIWDLFSLAGLYFLVVLYLNNTRDRAPIMLKVVSIILLTVLLILQGVSYISFQDGERDFDAIRQARAALAADPATRTVDTAYVVSCSAGDDDGEGRGPGGPCGANIDVYRNAVVYEKLASAGGGDFRERAASLVSGAHPAFGGYGRAATAWLKGRRDAGKDEREALLAYLRGLQGAVRYHHDRVRALPEKDFGASLSRYLAGTGGDFAPFRRALEEYLKGEGPVSREGALAFLAPIGASEQRHYREREGRHYLSYIHVDAGNDRVVEAGFTYVSYRDFMHVSAMKIIYSIVLVFTVVVFGFNLFFRGVLIIPLRRLVDGLREVGRGRLDARIPALLGDEIGFVSASFNEMAGTLRVTRERLDEYTATLEQKVEERTRELAHSEERYREILDNIQDGYYEVDLKGGITFINKAMTGIMGYPQDEIVGRNYGKFTDEHNTAIIYAIFNEVYRSGEPSGIFDYPVISKDGTERITEAVTSLIRDHRGAKIGFRGIIRDITDKKRAEDALRQSEENYRSVIDGGIIGYFEVDLKGTFTFCNQSFADFLGYSREEIVGMNFRAVTNREEAERILASFAAIFTGASQSGIVSMQALRKDGSATYGDNYVSLRKNAAGDIIGFRSVGLDTSERKRAEEALLRSEEKYRTFVEGATDGIFRNDMRGNFLYVNPSGQALLGYSGDELLTINYRDLVVSEHRERVLDHYRRQFAEGREEDYIEFPIIRKDGEVRWLGQKSRLSLTADGSWEFHGISRDIQDRKNAEEAQRELEEQKTRFFANISHEIRTPLTLMLSPIESVLQGDYGNRINRAFFDNLYRNGLRLFKLVNNLLDFSKIEAGRMKMKVREIDMTAFVRNYISAVHSAAESKGLSVSFTAETGEVPVFVDVEKFDKVIMNLFSNALKFTEKSGTVRVSVREDDGRCCVEFRDTGEGIPAKSMETIFDRFGQADSSATRRHEGTGIGLALAKELVEMHGGTIAVESRYVEEHPDDHGSVFTVTVPKGKDHFADDGNVEFVAADELSEAVADHRFHGMREMHDLHTGEAPAAGPGDGAGMGGEAVPRRAAPGVPPAGPGQSVLIVDDNPDMRDFLTHLLKNFYTVHIAENGRAGLDAVERVRPDLVITDVMMPVMDGNEMTRRLKEHEAFRHIPVVMLTAKAEMTHRLEGLEQGADDFLTKPFNSKELMARIRTLLKTREYEKEIFRRNYEIEQELEVARQLQARLLPEGLARLPGFDLHAVYIPMDKIGGDFYDYALRDRFIDLFIADVSGHGLPGAFLAMMTKMSLESVPDRLMTDRTLGLVNDVICRSTVNSNYVTAFLCTIDTATNTVKFSNAGHVPPLIYRKKRGEFIELKAKGMPLGWFRDLRLEEEEARLEPGDRLVLFTDGITECVDANRVLYGDARFREFIASRTDRDPRGFCSELLSDLREFSGSEKFDDDLTLVVFDVL